MSPDQVALAGEAMREEIEVVLFHSSLATRRDGEIVVALFDGNPMRCVAMFRGSPDAVFALAEELSSVLGADDS